MHEGYLEYLESSLIEYSLQFYKCRFMTWLGWAYCLEKKPGSLNSDTLTRPKNDCLFPVTGPKILGILLGIFSIQYVVYCYNRVNISLKGFE